MVSSTFNYRTIEAVVGTMYSGKTEYIQERKNRAERFAGVDVFLFKPGVDNRKERSISNARSVSSAWEMIEITAPKQIPAEKKVLVIVDDAQFFDETLPYAIQVLKHRGANVVVAGLDKDFRGQPFGFMPQVMALSDVRVNHFRKAVCYKCKEEDGVLPQRLRNGKPDSVWSPTVVVEGSDDEVEYKPACRKCHVVDDLAAYIIKQKELFCDS